MRNGAQAPDPTYPTAPAPGRGERRGEEASSEAAPCGGWRCGAKRPRRLRSPEETMAELRPELNRVGGGGRGGAAQPAGKGEHAYSSTKRLSDWLKLERGRDGSGASLYGALTLCQVPSSARPLILAPSILWQFYEVGTTVSPFRRWVHCGLRVTNR